MHIQALKLFVTEAEINELVKKYVPNSSAVEGLRVRLTPEGVVVQGEYPTFMMNLAFETLWEVRAVGAEVVARLANARVSGVPAGWLKGALMKMIRDLMGAEPGVRVQEDTLRVHLEEAARARSVPLRVNFTAVRCSVEVLVLEAGG
jgi:hypothetical protein